ncbi:MAG TPA: SDR family oxidoreductase [Tepidisphaeraceae bacterium]|nr:SDR family oxidoreductase [Tepidisphaeraceae bacterium]
MKIDWPKLHNSAFAGVPCLVTGGAGFIGSHIVDALVSLGARVTAIDDLSGGNRANLNPEARFIEASILDAAAVNHAVEGAQLVFHQAAKVSVPASVADPVLYNRVNVDGTVNVLDAARLAGARRFMFAASSSAYGDSPELPKIETMPPLAASPYAANKIAGEQMLRAYASTYGIDTVSLRYFNIFGPRQNANSAYAGVIAAFARKLLAGEAPVITGDGSATRDFTFVANAVHANLLAARYSTRFAGQIINIATGQATSVKQLAEAMARLLGCGHLKPQFAPPRPGDVPHSLANLEKAARVLDYSPIVDFETGLKTTVEWYRAAARG